MLWVLLGNSGKDAMSENFHTALEILGHWEGNPEDVLAAIVSLILLPNFPQQIWTGWYHEPQAYRERNPKVQTITIKQESVLGTRPWSYPINVCSFSWGHMRRQCLQMSADIMPYLLVCSGHTMSVSCWTGDECYMHLEMYLLFIASFVTVAFWMKTFPTQVR